MNDYKMAKYAQEMQNRYSCGHEQMEKRPYLIVYESNDYILGFPLTSRAKQLKSYPSHTNARLSTNKLDGEVMLDQLQFIHKADFTNLPNIPEFLHINKWLVVSSKHFNAYAKMCFIIPYSNDLDFGYLHSIDWEARGVNIINKLKYAEQDIQALQQAIKTKFTSICGYFAH